SNLILIGTIALLQSPNRGLTHHLVELTGNLDDERFVPVALTLLQSQFRPKSSQWMISALRQSLERLRSGQADCWKPEQMRALLSLLDQPEDDIELTLSILKALEQIGDERALPRVRFLAEDDYMADDTDARLSEYLGTVSGSRTQMRE